MTTVTLTPEQERFAAEAVAQGRFHDLDEVVRTGVALLQQTEAARVAFIASLEAAQAEGERDGFITLDQIEREMDEIIEAAERRGA